jgi:hypothetical protein
MVGAGDLLMSEKEAQRLSVLRRVLDEGLKQGQAAQQLGVWVRQVKSTVSPLEPRQSSLSLGHFVLCDHAVSVPAYSTVTLLARFLGLSTSVPRAQAV